MKIMENSTHPPLRRGGTLITHINRRYGHKYNKNNDHEQHIIFPHAFNDVSRQRDK